MELHDKASSVFSIQSVLVLILKHQLFLHIERELKREENISYSMSVCFSSWVSKHHNQVRLVLFSPGLVLEFNLYFYCVS